MSKAQVTYDWKGTTTTWATASNWSPAGPPTATDTVNFGVNVTYNNAPKVAANTSVAKIVIGKNGGVNTPLTINSGFTLTTTSGLVLQKSAIFALTGSSAAKSGFITKGTSTAASTSSIIPSTVAFQQQGTFTLLSDKLGTANVSIYTAATVNGNFNVQRYITGGSASYRSWRLLSSPVNNAAGVFNFANLQQTLILTGPGGATSGYDPPLSWATGYISNGPSVLFYNEPNTSLNDYTELGVSPAGGPTLTKPIGTGFWFFFRGDRINNLTNKLVRSVAGTYAVPESTVGTWTGALNSGDQVISTTYTPHTGATDDGFNLLGNPYPCTVDWSRVTFTAGAYFLNPLFPTTPIIWALDPSTGSITPAGVGNVVNYLAVGQGFYVQGKAAGSIAFHESSKDISFSDQPINSALMFSVKKTVADPFIQLEMIRDSLNADWAYIRFNDNTNPKYNTTDDINDMSGSGQNVLFGSLTADSVEVALNSMPLKPHTSVFLSVNATTKGVFSIKRHDLYNISSAYDVILMDHFTKDSLDLRKSDTYTFTTTSDPATYGNKRFEVILRVRPLPPYRLLSFTGQRVSDGNQLNWKTVNENTYTSFQVQRSKDNGKTFSSLGTMQSDSSGQYNYTDKTPGNDTSTYRLMQTDVYNNITYSSIVIISTTGSLVNFKIYPNPAASFIQFQANSIVQPPLKLNIYNSIGSIVKTATFSANTGTQDLSGLINGTYILEIIDVNTKKSLGTAKFSKF